MSVFKDVVVAVLAALVFTLIVVGAVFLSIIAGYAVGSVISVTPFISDLVTHGTPIDKRQLPSIMAWVVLIGVIMSIRIKNGDD